MPSERILVVQTAFLGDSILTLPMVQKLSELHPEAVIDVLCHPASKSIFSASGYIREVIVYDKRGAGKGIMNLFRLAMALRRKGYTSIYSPHRSARSSLLVWLSGAEKTYGFSNSSMKFLYSQIIPYRKDFHEVRRNLLMAGFDCKGDEWKILPDINISEADIARAERELDLPGKRAIAIAPSSVWATKRYPASYYAEIIRYLLEKSFNIILIGGKEDEEYCSGIASEFGNGIVNCAGKYSVTESVAILSRCRLLISNDSAPAHMALCADIPVLMIYCSTIADFGFYPYSTKGRFVSYDALECKPCGIHGHQQCPEGHFKCAMELKPQLLLDIIEPLLK